MEEAIMSFFHLQPR